jgi:hypothetical protein
MDLPILVFIHGYLVQAFLLHRPAVRQHLFNIDNIGTYGWGFACKTLSQEQRSCYILHREATQSPITEQCFETITSACKH